MHKYSLVEHFLFPPTGLNLDRLKQSANGKTILITGASSGIGESLAYQLANTDCHLVLVARREERLASIKSHIEQKSARVSIFPADLRNQIEMKDLLDFLHGLPEGLDFVISNAGKSINRPVFESLDRYHDFTRTMAVNYFAPVELLLSVIPLLEESRGKIINISTVNTLLIPLPHWAAYQASKCAFDTWFRSAAPELNARGIRTATVYLPLVKTPMIEPTAKYKSAPAMCPRHVARIICKLMYSSRRRFQPWWLLSGQWASLLFRGPWDRFAPGLLKKREPNHD